MPASCLGGRKAELPEGLRECKQVQEAWEHRGSELSLLPPWAHLLSPDSCSEHPSPWGHSLSPEQLHAQQGEDHDEEEEQEEQADDGLHGVEQGHHQVPQGVPVPTADAAPLGHGLHSPASVVTPLPSPRAPCPQCGGSSHGSTGTSSPHSLYHLCSAPQLPRR